jgi:hypothetical protein
MQKGSEFVDAVGYHDQTGGKFSRFKSGDGHFR